MPVTLADLDRDELLALAEAFCPADGPELLRARVEAARRRKEACYRCWERAAQTSVIDAQAAKRRIDSHGFDDSTRALMQKSKVSTQKAAELWKAYESAHRNFVSNERELQRAS